MPVPSQESKRSCICVLVVSSLSLSTILIFGFRTVSTVWYVLELFRQCGMFSNGFDSVICFRTVSIVWYVLELFQQCGMFSNCSDSVVCFRTVSTVWYVLELFRQCGMF